MSKLANVKEALSAALLGVGLFLFVAVGATAALVLNGIVLQALWGWFIVPLGLMEIGLAHAIGFNLLVRFCLFTQKEEREDSYSDKEIKKRLIVAILYPLLVLLTGWILHLVMV